MRSLSFSIDVVPMMGAVTAERHVQTRLQDLEVILTFLGQKPGNSNLCHANASFLRNLLDAMNGRVVRICPSHLPKDHSRVNDVLGTSTLGVSQSIRPDVRLISCRVLDSCLISIWSRNDTTCKWRPWSGPNVEVLEGGEHFTFLLAINDVVMILHGDEGSEVIRYRIV